MEFPNNEEGSKVCVELEDDCSIVSEKRRQWLE
jgi:hypothetical protein